jgi:hypothetical protein
MNTNWIFVIDTDDYAGNFERDMCAYLTGEIGECEVGEEFAEEYFKETGEAKYESRFCNIIESRSDDHGCHRPCSIWLSKRKKPVYNSVAIFFGNRPTDDDIKFMKERAMKFAEAKRKMAEEKDYSWDKKFKLTIRGFRLIREVTTEEEVDI